MLMRMAVPLLAVILCASPAGAASEPSSGIELEYIGHASFVLTSPGGVRLVFDPFSSIRWLGYRFPSDVEADAVLVTHPHYDHDASYYWGDDVPVFREAGTYRIADVEIRGVRGKHADPYGKDFEQKNTIWAVDTGGLRVAHLGDNGPLDEAARRQMGDLGRVDVLLIPIDGEDHILKRDEVAAIRKDLGDPLVIPMHYRLEGFLGLPRSLGGIDPWLEGREGVVRLDSNRIHLEAPLDPMRKVLVPRPSPELAPWSETLARAWEELDQARQIEANYPTQLSAATALIEKAYQEAGTIVFAFHWSEVLAGLARLDEAVGILEGALAGAEQEDWEYRMRARSLLGELYRKQGRLDLAAVQFRIVLAQSVRPALRDAARRFLQEHPLP